MNVSIFFVHLRIKKKYCFPVIYLLIPQIYEIEFKKQFCVYILNSYTVWALNLQHSLTSRGWASPLRPQLFSQPWAQCELSSCYRQG